MSVDIHFKNNACIFPLLLCRHNDCLLKLKIFPRFQRIEIKLYLCTEHDEFVLEEALPSWICVL